MKLKLIVGIDEVGRGPLAGPVAVGAFVFLKPEAEGSFKGVKESKQLSEEKREEWFTKILKAKKEGLVNFAVTFQSEKIIDKKGLTYAIEQALALSLKKLKINPTLTQIKLDGSLKAPSVYKDQKTIIKGDEKELVIALASICAKVKRDRYMLKMGQKYPQYGFEIHKGYGTKKHYQAILKCGISPLHRRLFLRKSQR